MEDKFILFFTVVFWILAIFSTLFLIANIVGFIIYNKNKDFQEFDNLRGVYRIFPIKKYFLLALISWSWIFIF